MVDSLRGDDLDRPRGEWDPFTALDKEFLAALSDVEGACDRYAAAIKDAEQDGVFRSGAE